MINWWRRLFDKRRLREIEFNEALIKMIKTVMDRTLHREDINTAEIVALNERMLRLRFRNKWLTEHLSVTAQANLLQKKLSNES